MFMYNVSGGGEDANRPSFFEMMAQQQMMPTFKPALRYIFSVMSQRNPELDWFVRHNDEIFHAGWLLIEHHYLKYYGGSFSENFYGLKRQRVSPIPGIGKETAFEMSGRDKFTSLFLLVVVPYLKQKLDKLYEDMSGLSSGFPAFGFGNQELINNEQDALRSHYYRFFKKLFLTVYPYVNAVYEGLFFIYQLLYLYDKTKYYTPFLHLQKIAMRRLTLQDMESQENSRVSRRLSRLRGLNKYPLATLLRGFVNAGNLVLDYSKYILPASLFFFKFLEWWYSENRIAAPTLPIPPPPPHLERAPEGLELPEDKTLCPLCLNPRTNPAIAASGYSFCYPCIFGYVQKHEKCPVTFLPTSQAQIRKIYEAR